MQYRYQKPHPLIANYVRTVLILEGFLPAQEDNLPIFTNGMPALVCKTEKDNHGKENSVQLTLYGKSIPDDCLSVTDHTTLIAYFFKPFAIAGFFNIAATTLNKSAVDLDNWNAHTTNALKTQLVYAGNTQQKVEALDHLLIHQWQQNKKECAIIQYATDQLMCSPGTDALTDLLQKLQLNERTFQRLFKKYVGITPGHFRRICQFHLSFTQLKAGQFDSLTDVAYDNGFADQSHFIRSFKEFTATTPNNYLRYGLKKPED